MSKNRAAGEPASPAAQQPKSSGRNKVVGLVVAAVFLGLVLVKVTSGGTDAATPSVASTGGASITSVRNDALADYEAALKTGKPVYVLFHSLTCLPCVEISEVADEVIPEYGDDVVFVNAITDDPSAQQLSAKLSFQYIPTSFFVNPDGSVADSFTGAMDAVAMRGYLDTLAAR